MAAPTAEVLYVRHQPPRTSSDYLQTLTSNEHPSTYGTFEDDDQVSASEIEVPEARDIIHDSLTLALILVIIMSVVFWFVNRKPTCKAWPCNGIIDEFRLG